MRSRRLLAVCALAALAAVTPARADEIGDALRQVDDTAYGAVVQAQGTVDRAVTVAGPVPPQTTRTLDYYTDSIAITDYGSGPVVSKGSVFSISNWWTCNPTISTGGSVVVTCTANPASGISWQCGIMHVHASVWSRPADRYDWARDTADSVLRPASAPSLPNPTSGRWGQAAGRVSCDTATLVTGQADRNNPYSATQGQLGPVSTLVCEARLSPTSNAAPVAPYTVNCVDPANPAKNAAG